MRFTCLKIAFLLVGIVVVGTGCSLIGLPFAVTEDVLEGTGVIVEEVGEAL